MKIPSKRKLQKIALEHSYGIDFDIDKDFVKHYKYCTKEPYPFVVNNTSLSSNNPLIFRKNLL